MADKDYTVTLNDVQQKALLGNMVSIQDWIDNSIGNKARKCINRYVELSGEGSRMSTDEKKAEIITGMTIETAEDRNKRLGID